MQSQWHVFAMQHMSASFWIWLECSIWMWLERGIWMWLACDLNVACVCKIARERFSFFWMQFSFVCLLMCPVRLSHTCTCAHIPFDCTKYDARTSRVLHYKSCTNVLSHSKLHSCHIQKCHKSCLVESHSNATCMSHSNSLVTFKCHKSWFVRTCRVLYEQVVCETYLSRTSRVLYVLYECVLARTKSCLVQTSRVWDMSCTNLLYKPVVCETCLCTNKSCLVCLVRMCACTNKVVSCTNKSCVRHVVYEQVVSCMNGSCRRERKRETHTKWLHKMTCAAVEKWYGVATISRIDKILGLFCRISSLI